MSSLIRHAHTRAEPYVRWIGLLAGLQQYVQEHAFFTFNALNFFAHTGPPELGASIVQFASAVKEISLEPRGQAYCNRFA
jgi:hypothetical protein